MTLLRKFGGALLALILSGGLAYSCLAQRQDRPRQESRQGARSAPRQSSPAARAQRREQQRNSAPVTRADRPSANRPNSARSDVNRADLNRPEVNRGAVNPNRPPASQYSRGAENNYGGYRGNQQRRLSPEERQRVLQNRQRFRQLSPQQQQDMRDRGRVWQQMTPQQRDHIKNDVLPTWRNMPPQRQKAIEQRLGVLQNMPENARNRHLDDPNFTRGMTDEDRATLRDLSHLHVGGAPDSPNE